MDRVCAEPLQKWPRNTKNQDGNIRSGLCKGGLDIEKKCYDRNGISGLDSIESIQVKARIGIQEMASTKAV